MYLHSLVGKKLSVGLPNGDDKGKKVFIPFLKFIRFLIVIVKLFVSILVTKPLEIEIIEKEKWNFEEMSLVQDNPEKVTPKAFYDFLNTGNLTIYFFLSRPSSELILTSLSDKKKLDQSVHAKLSKLKKC